MYPDNIYSANRFPDIDKDYIAYLCKNKKFMQ